MNAFWKKCVKPLLKVFVQFDSKSITLSVFEAVTMLKVPKSFLFRGNFLSVSWFDNTHYSSFQQLFITITEH